MRAPSLQTTHASPQQDVRTSSPPSRRYGSSASVSNLPDNMTVNPVRYLATRHPSKQGRSGNNINIDSKSVDKRKRAAEPMPIKMLRQSAKCVRREDVERYERLASSFSVKSTISSLEGRVRVISTVDQHRWMNGSATSASLGRVGVIPFETACTTCISRV